MVLRVSAPGNGSASLYRLGDCPGLPPLDDLPARRAAGEGDDFAEPPATGGGKHGAKGSEVTTDLGKMAEEVQGAGCFGPGSQPADSWLVYESWRRRLKLASEPVW